MIKYYLYLERKIILTRNLKHVTLNPIIYYQKNSA